MAKIAILYKNLADQGVVSAVHQVSTLPGLFVQHAHLTRVWRTPVGVTSSAIRLDQGVSKPVRCTAVFACNLTAAGAARVKLSNIDWASAEIYDSGFLNPAGIDPVYGAFIHILPATISARYVRVELQDASLDYVEAGRLVVGPMWMPDYNYERGIERFTVDRSTKEVSIAGDIWSEEVPTRRGVLFGLPAVSKAELELHLDAMGREAGTTRDILVCLDPASTNLARDTYWGTMTDAPRARGAGHRIFRQQIEVIER